MGIKGVSKKEGAKFKTILIMKKPSKKKRKLMDEIEKGLPKSKRRFKLIPEPKKKLA